MLGLYLIIFLLLLFGVRFCRDGFFKDYMGKEQCNSIKGIFIIFVFARHIFSYISLSGYDFSLFGDHIALFCNGAMKQLLVAMFLFYSGYGVTFSFLKKGKSYISSFLQRRVLTTLLNFDVAIIFFLIVDLLIGRDITIYKLIFSFVCWESIGNSNWYIFAILICYVSFYCVIKYKQLCRFFEKKSYSVCVFAILLVYILLMVFFKPHHWYNTIFCFPLGVMFAEYKFKIEKIITSHFNQSCIIVGLLFLLFYILPDYGGIPHNICSIFFCLFIVILSFKVKVNNRVLIWLGANLFPLYIYQRIPMMCLYSIENGNFVKKYIIAYIILSASLTLFLSYLYKYWKITLK